MNKLSLGGAQFGMSYGISNNNGKILESELQKIFELAKKYSVNKIDTAINYGDSETTIGYFADDSFKITTKVARLTNLKNDIKSFLIEEVTQSLSRLKKKCIHALLLHDASDMLGEKSDEVYKALASLKELGLINKIGISIYSPDSLTSIFAKYSFDIVQAPVNLFDRRLERSGWLKKLKDMGVEIQARSVFMQGLLLMNRKDLPIYFAKWTEHFNTWFSLNKKDPSLALQACLSYPLSLKYLDHIVVGVASYNNLLEIFEASKQIHEYDTKYDSSEINDLDLIDPRRWNLI
jgi:aryl-alcohol dehydrogenase-like predicted oxidoreductase